MPWTGHFPMGFVVPFIGEDAPLCAPSLPPPRPPPAEQCVWSLPPQGEQGAPGLLSPGAISRLFPKGVNLSRVSFPIFLIWAGGKVRPVQRRKWGVLVARKKPGTPCRKTTPSFAFLLQDCISLGSGEPNRSSYHSFVLYHSNSPRWGEMVKLPVPIDRFRGSHLRFEFRHCSSEWGCSPCSGGCSSSLRSRMKRALVGAGK